MKKIIAPLIFGLVLAGLVFSSQLRSGLRCAIGSDAYTSEQYLAMGTLIGVAVIDCDADRTTAAMQAAEKAIRQTEADWHAWEPSRLLSINQELERAGRAEIPADLLPRIQRAQAFSRISKGSLDPGIGRLVALWGFNDEENFLSEPPPDFAISSLLKDYRPFHQLKLEDAVLHAPESTWMDFGAIAKGHGVDVAIDAIRSSGVENALVDGGGDLRVLGQSRGPNGKRPWTIGLRNPRGEGLLAKVTLQSGEALFTSGDYERYFEYGGRRYHHILKPHDGYPTRGVASISVIAADGELADAASTALMVANREDWPAIAAGFGIDKVLRVGDDGAVTLTDAMQARVEFVNDAGRDAGLIDLGVPGAADGS